MTEQIKNIVIIEDNTTIMELTSYILQSNGYKVFKFKSGKGMKTYLRRNNIYPDLFIIDVCLTPPEDGRNIHNKLRNGSSRFKYVPILLFSSLSKQEVYDFKFVGEAPELLEKPFGKEDLFNKINKFVHFKPLILI